MISGEKVFCIGAHKTGTTSMGAALTRLGFDVFPEPLWYRDLALQAEFYAGRYAQLDELIRRYDAFEDSPFNHSDFFIHLYDQCPAAKFILTVRDTSNLVASHKRWLGKLQENLLPLDGELSTTVRRVLECEYGQRDGIDDEDRLACLYEGRNRRVTEFFRDKPKQFLTIDVERETEPWRVVCEFLNCEAPLEDFPHLKRTR
jgi:hypothetical protein